MTYDYENTYPRDRYADGCACSGCRSEGQVDTQPEETCTVTRYAIFMCEKNFRLQHRHACPGREQQGDQVGEAHQT